MTFDEYCKNQEKTFKLKIDYPTKNVMRITWGAAIEESAEKAENIKSPKFTKSWNEACDEIAEKIRKAK